MRIEQSVIDDIKNKTDILDLVSEYVKLEKRGRNYIGLCPFHDEKTPSFTVSEDKQICHCFGCKKGGNVFQFIQEIKDISFTEAVQELGARVNITVNAQQENQNQNSSHQMASSDLKMIEMHELMQQYYHYALKKSVEGETALSYLKDRGFTDELIDARKIGYAPNNSHFCHDFLEKKGYDTQLAYEAGLLSRNEENFSYYDRFRDRIMFPLTNSQGRTVGYSGRTYTNQEPKYLNSPETPIFQKRRLLYNVDLARKAIRKNDEAILLEGFMDVIKADKAGLKQVIASMGTQLSQDHITFLKKLTNNITLMFDGDFAGSEATLKTGNNLLKQGFNVFVVQLPKDMDPDEYIGKHGEQAFNHYVEHEKKAFILYKVNMHQDEIENNDLAYEKYLKEITNDISYMSSTILRKKVIQDVSEVFKVNLDSLNDEIDSQHSYHQIQSYQAPSVPQFTNLSKEQKAERALLKHFMNDKDTFLNYHKLIELEDFTNEFFKRIFNTLREFYAENDSFSISDVLQYIDISEIKEAFISLDNFMINEEPYENEIDDYINTITKYRTSETLESLNNKLIEATRLGDQTLQKQYLEQIVNFNKNRMN